MGAVVYRRWWPCSAPEGAAALMVAGLGALGASAAGPLVLRVDEDE